jgi:hypothetical protein
MYTRKTKDVWMVQQYTGSQYGWEDVYAGPETPNGENGPTGRKDALARLKEYRQNDPGAAYRMKIVRERITA